MNQARLPSFLLSVCLHLALLVLVLFWPAPDVLPPTPDGPLITGIITIGTPGGPATKQSEPPVEEPKPSTPEIMKEPDLQPTLVAQPTIPPVEKVPPKVVKPPEDPNEGIPIITEPVKKPPQKNATAVAQTKNATIKPVQNATAKAPPQNATAKAPTQNATAKAPAKGDDLKKAMSDMRSAAAKGGGASKGDPVRGALSDFGREAGGGGNTRGSGPGGEGGDGRGVLGSYMESVKSRVKRNWAWTERADRKNFVADVEVNISPKGEVLGARIISTSGNSVFDSSVITAVKSTTDLEPPPKTDLRTIRIKFNSAEAGR